MSINTQFDTAWQCLLELTPDRTPVSGDRHKLRDAIAHGADLRVFTEWLFEEHIAPDLSRPMRDEEAGLIQEVIDFRQTIVVDSDNAVGITNLRQAILPLIGFNPNGSPRMSFFMYDLDGRQACANVLLDDTPLSAEPGATRIIPARAEMPKMSEVEQHDAGTSGPSVNFIYDFERYRYFVRSDWQQLLHHDASGQIIDGSFDELHAAHRSGCELKVAIRNLAGGELEHEVISLVGTSWVHTARGELEGLTHPLVRLIPGRPIKYASGNWDVAWVFMSTNGDAKLRVLDPYTRQFRDETGKFACRWFVR